MPDNNNSVFFANEGTQINPKVKDRLFNFVFGSFENKIYLLSLYNAINDSDYDDPDELEITTLDDVVYINMKNDVSFLLDSCINLYEHQSTFNPNIPLRGLMYFGHLYDSYLARVNKDYYSGSLVKIPTPRYYVFYNGLKEQPDRTILRLSDAFMIPDTSGDFEWSAVMLNINTGHNKELMNKCQALSEYSQYVADFREALAKGMSKESAAEEAINKAISRPCLGKFFLKWKGDVTSMLLTEFNQKEYDERRRDEGREEGREEGKSELARLITLLIKSGRESEIEHACSDPEYMKKLEEELL